MTIYDEAMQMEEELVACRRDLHAHPELAWTEFRTASHVAKSLKALGYEVLMGDACMKADEMMGVPDKAELSRAMGRAIKEGADPELVKRWKAARRASWASCILQNQGRPWVCALTWTAF